MGRTVGSVMQRRHQPSARQRMWQSMRILRRFTIGDLEATAEATRHGAQRYVSGLERAGYLTRAAERVSGVRGGAVQFRLVRDSGPQAPVLYRGAVRDLNTAEVAHG